MTIKEKNEIIDEVKRQLVTEMASDLSEVMCRVFSALDYLESNLDDYYRCIEDYID